MPTDIMTAEDIRILMKPDIPTKVAASYQAQQCVRSLDPEMGVKPFMSAIRVTTFGFFDMFKVPMRFGATRDGKADEAIENIAVISHSTNPAFFGGGDNVRREFKIGDQVYSVIGIMHAWPLAPRVYDLTQSSARTEGVFVPLSDFQRSRLKPGRFASLESSPSNESGLDFLGDETIFASLWVQLETQHQVQDYREFMDNYLTEQKALGRLPRPMNNQLYSATDWIVVAPVNAEQRDMYKTFILLGAV
jgi:putative ABC transport system permease protein